MLRRLEGRTCLPCNSHNFRRTFACLLRKTGVDTMTIKDFGRWESLDIVQHYTRSMLSTTECTTRLHFPNSQGLFRTAEVYSHASPGSPFAV
ncbi:MAG: site-specific integrase [Planctomycetes bacterium]|nr:site-specific integrase [Planctomycetota bacterium]